MEAKKKIFIIEKDTMCNVSIITPNAFKTFVSAGSRASYFLVEASEFEAAVKQANEEIKKGKWSEFAMPYNIALHRLIMEGKAVLLKEVTV